MGPCLRDITWVAKGSREGFHIHDLDYPKFHGRRVFKFRVQTTSTNDQREEDIHSTLRLSGPVIPINILIHILDVSANGRGEQVGSE